MGNEIDMDEVDRSTRSKIESITHVCMNYIQNIQTVSNNSSKWENFRPSFYYSKTGQASDRRESYIQVRNRFIIAK